MGWGFLDDLDDAFEFVKKAGANTAADVAQITPVGLLAGAVADIARHVQPGEDDWFDRGPGRHLGVKRGTLKSAGDLFASEDTLTGAGISKAFEGLHWVSEHVFLGGLEAAMTVQATRNSADPIGWGEAYNLSLTRSFGETSLMAHTAVAQSGDDSLLTKVLVPGAVTRAGGLPGADDDAAKTTDAKLDFRDTSTSTVKGDDGTIEKYQNVVAKAMEKDPAKWQTNVAALGTVVEIADPTFGAAATAIRSGKAAASFKLQDTGWDRLAGKLDDTGDFKAGKLDEWDASQIYAGLRLNKHAAGRRIAEILDNSKKLDPQARLAVRDGIARVMNKDASGIALIAKHDLRTADEVTNMVTGTVTGSVAAGLLEDAAEATGKVLKPLTQPEVVAEGLAKARLDPKFEDYVDLLVGGDKMAMRATASGNRALGRLGRVGEKSPWQPDRVALPGGQFRPGVEFMGKGLRTIGWATGITPTKKALAAASSRLSDNLRDPHIYGVLDVNDEHLSIGVVRHMMHTAGVSQKTSQEFLSRATLARTPEERALVVLGAKNAAVHAMARRHGKDPELVERLLRASDEDSKALLTAYEGQAYASTRNSDTLRRTDIVFLKTDDGDVVLPKPTAAPVYGTQAVNHVAIPDLRRIEFWLKKDKQFGALSRKLESMRGQGAAQTVMESTMTRGVRDAMESMNGYWKASVLLPRFISYATRNQVEEYLRAGVARSFLPVLARSGAQQKSLTAGGKVRHVKGEIDDDPILRTYRPHFEAALDRRRLELDDLDDDLDAVDDIWANFKKAEKRGDDLSASGEYAYVKDLHDQAAKLREEVAELEGILGGVKVPDSGKFRIDGTNLSAEQAYAGDEGRFMFDYIGGKGVALDLEMIEYGRRAGSRLRGYGSVIHPSMEMTPDELVRYHKAVYEVLNRHVRTDPLGQIALNVRAGGGSADDMRDAVLAHLRSPEGRAVREKVPTRSDMEQWADAVATEVDNLVRTPDLATRLRNRDVNQDDLDEFFVPNPDERFLPPSVHESGASATFGAQARVFDRGIRRSFEAISRFSTDRLTRHPHFALMYEDDLTNAVHRLIEADIAITPAMMKSMQSAARRSALQQLRKTYYQNSERSTAAHQMRFLSPFFAAHQDSVRYWVKAVGENPEFLRRAMVGYAGMQSAGVVTDEEGRPVKPGTFPENNHVVHLGLGGHDWNLHPSSALLMIQQGSLTNPGFGPLAAVTVGELQNRLLPADKDVAKIAKYFIPMGYNGPVRSVEPAWAQRIHEFMSNDYRHNLPELTRLYKIQLRDGITDWRLANGDREPTDSDLREIAKDADAKMKQVTLFRAIASIAAPMQPSPQSKFSAAMDEFNRLRDYGRRAHKGDPFWAEEKFLEKYGDAMVALTVSESTNRTGLDPTLATRASMDAHKKLRGEVNSSLWGLIVGPESKDDPGEDDDFDMNTYKHIRDELDKSPEGGKRDTSMDYLNDVSVAAGWRKFDRRYKVLMNMAQAKGLQGPEQDKDLSVLLKLLRHQIGEENPQWRFANDPNAKQREWPTIEEGARKIANHKRFLRDPARPEIKQLGEYLNIRDQVAAELKRRIAKGGASTIGAEANRDLRVILALKVMLLKEQNTDFETYVMRHVVWRDPFYDEEVFNQVKEAAGADDAQPNG